MRPSLFDADLDVIVEATGNPIVGINHALRAIETGKHIIMVTVEADALAGPALAKRAKEAGVVYSLAYGDQPALIWELVDWARTSGFDVVCAGKGAKYLVPLPPDEPGQRLGELGILEGTDRLRPAQPLHAHLLPRRHQSRHRDGGRGQRGRPAPVRRRADVHSRRRRRDRHDLPSRG